MSKKGLKLYIVTIVDEPENAPTVLIGQSDEEIFQKLKSCDEVQHLTDLDKAQNCEEIAEMWENAKDEGMLYEYSGIFLEEQTL